MGFTHCSSPSFVAWDDWVGIIQELVVEF